MMRIIFGALLGLLVAFPALGAILLAIAGTAAVAAASYPPLLAAALGVWAWPRISRTVRGWTS
ncbi:hypothetical protein OIE75_20345 [Streptomyces sp. NBC_01723]|uniref:hypothetical protein n=1 Tax=Streptomyces sp. NBC_01723 TaxID=2975921 RepID=UPI002E30AF45|nr:hypothetical protein [Streptomyces sp. NBC_01723]